MMYKTNEYSQDLWLQTILKALVTELKVLVNIVGHNQELEIMSFHHKIARIRTEE